MNESVALITGASRGIGAAILRQAQSENLRCFGVSRSKPADLLPGVNFTPLDLARPEDLHHWLEREWRPLLKKGGKSLLVVNNAGKLGAVGRKSNDETLAQTYALNVRAPLAIIRCVLSASAFAKNTIVNLSSGAATRPYAGWLEYCTSKAALQMASQVLIKEYEENMYPNIKGLQIIDYSPGVVDTTMQNSIRSENPDEFPNREKFVELKTSGRLIQPEQTAQYLFTKLKTLRGDGYFSFRYGD